MWWNLKESNDRNKRVVSDVRRQFLGYPSLGIVNQELKKRATYAPLLAVAQKQIETGKRINKPIFVPAICTTHGEFGQGFIHIQEWLVKRFKARITLEGDRDDGIKPDQLTAQYRQRIRSSILVAMVKGQAQMLCSAGLHDMTCRRNNRGWLNCPSYCSLIN